MDLSRDSGIGAAAQERAVQQQIAINAEIQRRYALVLMWGTRVGLTGLVIWFGLYMSGIVSPYVPVDTLPSLWNQSVHHYLEATHSPTGWGWAPLIGKADIGSVAGIAFLASWSVVCLLAIMPLYRRAGLKTYLGLCAVEVAVQLLAASNVLTAGH